MSIYLVYMFGGDKLYRGLMAIDVFHAVCWLCIHCTSIFGALQTKRMVGTWKDMDEGSVIRRDCIADSRTCRNELMSIGQRESVMRSCTPHGEKLQKVVADARAPGTAT